jgi:hypothetical protein
MRTIPRDLGESERVLRDWDELVSLSPDTERRSDGNYELHASLLSAAPEAGPTDQSWSSRRCG